jgi:hypothetical protein
MSHLAAILILFTLYVRQIDIPIVKLPGKLACWVLKMNYLSGTYWLKFFTVAVAMLQCLLIEIYLLTMLRIFISPSIHCWMISWGISNE